MPLKVVVLQGHDEPMTRRYAIPKGWVRFCRREITTAFSPPIPQGLGSIYSSSVLYTTHRIYYIHTYLDVSISTMASHSLSVFGSVVNSIPIGILQAAAAAVGATMETPKP